MGRSTRLKVYRSSVGFHDAYVAAPSKKAALEAWGAARDLFAIGAAELVTDPELTAEPLAAPGKVIKRSRGGLAEQLAALPERKTPRSADTEQKRPAKAKAQARAKPRPKPKPPPDRARLEAAEAELASFTQRAEAELAEFQEREEALRRERAALEREQERAGAKLQRAVEVARQRYEAALEKWRAD